MKDHCGYRDDYGQTIRELSEWHTPKEFISKVAELDATIKSSNLFNRSNLQFLLDALAIAEFAKHRQMDAVRLVPEQEGRNDGQYRQSGRNVDLEVTELMEPGRRRGDEYRCGQIKQSAGPHFDLNQSQIIAHALAARVQAKVAKGYSTKPTLLVLIQFGLHGRRANDVELMITRLRSQFSDAFPEICVLWEGKLH